MENSNNIKEIAKHLCEKSGCHHKCHDTKDCVVEDEALLLINENKSNNFDVKSNEELFKQALVEGVNNHIDNTIEEEKQIDIITDLLTDFDEMGFAPTTLVPNPEAYAIEWRNKVTNALQGYRKQSEGEWTYDYTGEELLGTDAVYQYKCSLCGEHSIVPWRYCPDCGAKMKGGEE